MAELSPKIEIIKHFDNLIHQIDIDIDQTIEKYKENQILGELSCLSIEKKNSLSFYLVKIEYFDSNESSHKNNVETMNKWSESTKVIDYLNQVREKTIDELRKAQKDSLDYLKSNSCDLKESNDVEEMKSRLFADKFYFQVFYKPKFQESWVYNLFTIVSDFYLSPFDIILLEYLINYEEHYIRKFCPETSLFFDEKFLLIHSMTQIFCKTMETQQYPSHLISFRKRDLLNIKSIDINTRCITDNMPEVYFKFSLPKLERLASFNCYFKRVRIEGLSSLKSLSLNLASIEECSFCKMDSLRKLDLKVLRDLNNSFFTKLFEICPNIEELSLHGRYLNINIEGFVNLKKLTLVGNLMDNFNFKKSMCKQLEELDIFFYNMNDESISKLLCSLCFPNLSKLRIDSSKITRLEKKLFEGFPMLKSLYVLHNSELKTIDKEAFSNFKNLTELVLISNELSEFDPELFSCLKNLGKLNLASNKLTHFDVKIKHYLININEIRLSGNKIVNKQEILHHFRETKIIFEY